MTFNDAVEFVLSYPMHNYGGSLFLKNGEDGKIYLWERMYCTYDRPDYTCIFGPMTETEADVLLIHPRVHNQLTRKIKTEEPKKMAWDSPLKYEERLIVEWMQMPEKTKQTLIRVLLEKGVVKIGSKLELYVDENHPALSGQEKAE